MIYTRNSNVKWNIDSTGNLIIICNNSIYEIEGFFVEVWKRLDDMLEFDQILEKCKEIFEELPDEFPQILNSEIERGVLESYIIKKE